MTGRRLVNNPYDHNRSKQLCLSVPDKTENDKVSRHQEFILYIPFQFILHNEIVGTFPKTESLYTCRGRDNFKMNRSTHSKVSYHYLKKARKKQHINKY